MAASSKKKYEWKLTCKERSGGCDMWIGIQSNRNVDADYDGIDYGYDGSSGNKFHLGKREEYGIRWVAGDVIEMRVDFEKQEMGYSVNGIDQGIAFRNLQLRQTYFLVVCMNTGWQGAGNSIFLSDFRIHESKEEEKETDLKESEIGNQQNQKLKAEQIKKEKAERVTDLKESEIAKLKEKMNNLQKEKAEITNQYERILNEALSNQQNPKKRFDDEKNALKTE
eukprot:UN06883